MNKVEIDENGTGTTSAVSLAVNLISNFEGLRLQPYLDSTGIPTIGYGATRYQDGTPVTMADKEITKQEAIDLLVQHVNNDCLPVITRCVCVSLNNNQEAAIISFIYNVGSHNFEDSTLLRFLNAGDFTNAANEFQKWARAGGRLVPGLARRRAAERALFLTD